MARVRAECGDVGEFTIGDRDVVLLTGADANEFYFRAPEEQLDQAEAYPFMTPIFGKGVVFDAPPERRREMLHNQALRDKFMRGHAATIAREVEQMVAGWDDEGEIDLLDWFAELTIYTSSACLIGARFRQELDGRFARLYHDLERGTDPIAYVDPYADIESFRRRDAARAALVELVQGIMDRRAAGTPAGSESSSPSDWGEGDLLDVLMSIKEEDGSLRFSADTVTGMFISMMFAGHHTTSGTAAWTLIELLRHPDEMAAVRTELAALYADGSEVSFQALREIPRLESSIKEALRLHPPLILLLRVAMEDLSYRDCRIAKGKFVAASPAICNRIPEDFPDPDAFVPERYLEPREEDRANPWTWIPFGAGRHRCVGAAFAMMQLKAIFSVLLQGWEFEAAQPLDSYRNDHSKMVVQLEQPCRVRYRRRAAVGGPAT
jgi:sterol 14-demethylase